MWLHEETTKIKYHIFIHRNLIKALYLKEIHNCWLTQRRGGCWGIDGVCRVSSCCHCCYLISRNQFYSGTPNNCCCCCCCSHCCWLLGTRLSAAVESSAVVLLMWYSTCSVLMMMRRRILTLRMILRVRQTSVICWDWWIWTARPCISGWCPWLVSAPDSTSLSWDSDDVVAAVAVAGAPPPHWPWCCWQSWWWGYWPKTLASELLSASLETQTWWNVSIVIEVTKTVFLDTGDVSSVVTKERLNVNTGDQFYKCSGPLNGFLASDWSVVTLPPSDLPSLKAFQVSVTHFWVTPPRTPAWALSLNLHP